MHHSKLIDCSEIDSHSIQRIDETRTLLVDDETAISFTPTEYQLLLPLLSGTMIQTNKLVYEALGYDLEQWGQKNLNKYIDKLRSKICPIGLDVHRVARYGYVLCAPYSPT